MAAKWQRVWIEVPRELSANERMRCGKEIVEFIRKRSESGMGVVDTGDGFRNKRFPGYSKAYINSLDFEIAGKSAGSVDLTLSGDMLIALDVLDTKPGAVLIGFEKGSDENARADGNIRGTYGRSSPMPGKARNFLGISDSDLRRITRKYEKGEA